MFIAGVCGTFMAGIALLARELGMRVRGCDANVYPPMSEQLREAGIEVLQGYEPSHLDERPHVVVIGNALSRGNALVEYVLDEGIPYVSGPQWLWENVLHDRHVAAVAGTHGKTSTSSMLAWILEAEGRAPGFLIGGIPADFGISARLGTSDCFVIEADEYDTAFFDKRSKFVHYRPRTLVINNIEYDHADIFPDLESIQRQFHHLVRTVPASGVIVHPPADDNVAQVLRMGVWSRRVSVGIEGEGLDWNVRLKCADASALSIEGPAPATPVSLQWNLCGRHNAANAVAAMAAAAELGVAPERAAAALRQFRGVKRRLEVVGRAADVTVYDDFAHHPTAIATTLEGLRAAAAGGRIIAVIEPRSNTMRLGAHRERLPDCTRAADQVFWFQPPGVDWNLADLAARSAVPSQVCTATAELISQVVRQRQAGDRVVIMSNGGFEGIHRRMLEALAAAAGS